MMEGLNYQNSRLVSCCIILCIFIAIQSTCAQKDFQSIRCCSISSYTDPNKIDWITDNNLFSDNRDCQDIAKPVKHDTSYDKVRFFSSPLSSKWCYNLPTKKDQHYLIRGTFPFEDFKSTPQDAVFDILIGITSIAQLNFSEVEGIVKATDDYTNFCLSNVQGNPYISKLEIRPLASDYLNTEPLSVLRVLHRVDVGSNGANIRFPFDQYDRIWRPESIVNQPGNTLVSENAYITTSANGTEILPPIQVLQTARTHQERLEFHHALDPKYKHILYLYFLELNSSVQVGERVFDIFINNVKRQRIDIKAGGSNYSVAVMNITTNEQLNLTMIKASNSTLWGPICNAYEILQVHTWQQASAQEDVSVMESIKKQLLENNSNNDVLESWSGDPCLPHSWHGLCCNTSNGSTVVTKLDLSCSKFRGMLPPSITQLAHLTELNVSNNKFTSSIPEFPAFSMLTSVDLRNNDFMGKVPESLTSLPHLKTLYYGCNRHFNRELPGSQNLSRLVTDYGKCAEQRLSHRARTVLIGAIAGASFLITAAVASLICVYKKRNTAKGKPNLSGQKIIKNAIYSISSLADQITLKSITVQSFTLRQIESATQQYKTLIGEGGFGSVYRGTLPDGQEVAVKVRSATSTQGTREFDNELNLLSDISHENLVPLLGFCCENDQQILVYPFMSNGSLQDRLYGDASKRRPLDWPTRLSIALGAARGLTYLHSFSGRCVIHRDVKSSNILLDQSMNAKVADFGFSKYAPQEGDSGASLEVRGTAGYLDPEYYSTQHLSAKSDVFSFGVVLLEIISGREPLNIHRPQNEWSLVEWAKPYIRNSRIDEIVDPNIKGGYHAEAMWRVVEVALACIEPFSAYRPCMVDIVRELEDALIIENNASEYMRSIDSFGGSNRFSIERPIVILPTPTPSEPSSLLSQPAPPQPR